MKSFREILETYLMVLIHPFRIHQQFRFHVAIPGHEGHLYNPLQLSEALSLSWVFAIIRGLGKIIILNFFLVFFLDSQKEDSSILLELIQTSGISAYYFLLFSAAIDIIFFPIAALVITEVWSWIIRTFSKFLNPELPHEEIADQITTHALSSNLFSMVPILGDIIQSGTYLFLIYAGLRSNLEASRPLATIILMTPALLATMAFCLLGFTIFCLVSAT